jgi:hypothetical protein
MEKPLPLSSASATRTAVTAPYPARRHTHLLHFNVTLPKPFIVRFI